MNKKIKCIITISLFLVIVVGFCMGCVLAPDQALSTAERRKLRQLPGFSWATLTNGKYFSDLESYFLDQFVWRDFFRSVKAYFKYDLLRQKDNNGVFVYNGGIFKLTYPLDKRSVANAAEKYNEIISRYFADNRVFYTVVPDKSYFVQESGYLTVDYDSLEELMRATNATYIDSFDKLSIKDYYTTDLHWQQSCITDLAAFWLDQMGSGIENVTYEEHTLQGFYGGYYGQAAVAVPADTLTYLTNEVIDGMLVTDLTTGKALSVYAEEKFTGMDGYDVYLHGAQPLLMIENANVDTDKELIIFRDSYGSSIAPLLAQAYSKVTLVDIRYITPELAASYGNFSVDADVLFMYNALMLNDSALFK